MEEFWAALLGGLFSGTVIAAVFGVLTTRTVARTKAEVEDAFKRITEVRYSRRALLEEVLGPICAHLNRTKIAFRRWKDKNLSLESAIIMQSNRQIRDILLSKYHLLTPDLRGPANKLVEHYDRWLEEYEKVRGAASSGDHDFVFTGPKGYPFPHDSEAAFLAKLDETYNDLTSPGMKAR